MVSTLKKKRKNPLLEKKIIRLVTLFGCLWSLDTIFIIQKSCSSNLLVDKIK